MNLNVGTVSPRLNSSPELATPIQALFSQEFQHPNASGQDAQLPRWLHQFQQDGLLYLVQEYIPGKNLAAVLAEKGIFTAAEVWQVLASLLPTIQRWHRFGMIHGDIKPENIICRVPVNPPLTGGNLADLVLVDIGAAAFATERAALQAGVTSGSPAYAAPEQLKGATVFASDLYSLGVTGIHLLTGIHPFNLFDFGTHQWAWRNYWLADAANSQERLDHQQLADLLDRLIDPDLQQRLGSAAAAIAQIQNRYPWQRKVPGSGSTHPGQSSSSPGVPPGQGKSPAWECMSTLVGHAGLFAGVNAIAIAPDGNLLASASDDKTIRLWDMQTGQESFRLCSHQFVKSVAFHPHAQTILASGSRARVGDRLPSGIASLQENCTIQLWDLETRRVIHALTQHPHTVNAVLFSPDGKLLASGSADKTVKLWRTETGELITSLKGHTLAVTALAFNPGSLDGESQPILASASIDATVRLWHLNTFAPIHTLTGHTDAVRAVAFSATGNWLATAGEDRTIRLWDKTSWQCIRTLSGHPWVVSALVFSADGKTLISGSWDKTIKLWQVSTGNEIASLVGHTDAVSCIAIAPHNRMIASGSYDKTIKLWRELHDL
jgi:WD40 repeat protein